MNYKPTTYASFDGMKLSGYIWEPKEFPKAIINLVHGYSEHSERYDYRAMQFTKSGFLVHAIDYRGHGRSDGKRGHLIQFDDFLKDIDVLVEESKKLYPNLPQFIYGQSLGGTIVTNYILKRENNFKGAIISSPWYKLSFNPPAVKLVLARIMNKLYPKLTQKSKLEVNALTHDKDIVAEYISDPLVHEKISVRMFNEIYKAGNLVYENIDNIKLPILVQHGNKDNITSFKASKEFADKVKESGKDITFKEWDGMYHELHNELEKDIVAKYVCDWIKNKLVANS